MSALRLSVRSILVAVLVSSVCGVVVGVDRGVAAAANGDLTAVLLRDVNPGTFDSAPGGFVEVGANVLFLATDATSGEEWRATDGTSAGTALAKDIGPGATGGGIIVGSQPAPAVLAGSVFFGANDGSGAGSELWKSDGTAAGTVLVKDINAGSGNGIPSTTEFTTVGGAVYFLARTAAAGIELWKTDGTAAGTALVKDIVPGTASVTALRLTAVGGTLFFAASDGVNGTEPWKSDGTAGGTVMLQDIRPGANGSSPTNLTSFGGSLYFSANSGTTFPATGNELWKSDGTSPGTTLVKDINPLAASGNPASLAVAGSTLYFAATSGGATGVELWKSDGTGPGTVLVKDINPSSSSNPAHITAFGGDVLFRATTGSTDTELYRSDGTSAGTSRVKDIRTGSAPSDPASFGVVGATAYFSANDGIVSPGSATELWKTDGTAAGTVLVRDINPAPGASGSPTLLTPALGTLFFSATDGSGPGSHGLEPWHIRAESAPVAVADAYTVSEDTALSVPAPGVVGNDTDVDGDALSAGSASTPAHGTVALSADGSFTYTPGPDYNGSDSFTYVVSDGQGGTATGTVSLTVQPVNDAPVAVADAYSTDEDTALTVPAPGLVGNDTDIEGDPLSAGAASTPPNGTVTVNLDGSFTYTPSLNFTGVDSFTYQASDGTDSSLDGIVTVTVNPVNDAPVCSDVTLETTEETPGATDPACTDVEDDPLTYAIVSQPASGTASVGLDDKLHYDPVLDFAGTDSFTYGANDGLADSAPATVAVTVGNVNDAPVCSTTSLTTDEDTPGMTDPACTDVDGDALTATVVDQPTSGTASAGLDGKLHYTPGLNFNGSDSFTYRAGDGNLDSNVATVSVTVTPVNDAPLCSPVSITTDEEVEGSTAPSCTDVEGDALTFAIVDQPTSGTSSVGLDGLLHYTPQADFFGSDSFTYSASDGTASSAPATVSATVVNVNDAPVAADDAASTNEDTPWVVLAPGVLANDVDVDGDTLTAGSASTPANGSVVVNADGSATYTPAPDFFGVDTFTYEVSDGNGETDTAEVTITVVPVNDAPVAGDDTFATTKETALTVPAPGVLADDTDIDGVPAATAASDPPGGSVSLNADGSLTYTPDAGFAGVDTFTYVASDGDGGNDTATVTVTVNDTGATSMWVADAWLFEGSGGTTAAVFTVSRSGSAAAPSTVAYKTSGGSAAAGVDYTPAALTTLSFAAGEVSKPVTVDIAGDTVPEGDETFNLLLSAPTGGTIADTTGEATIVNDDGNAYLSVANVAVVEGSSGSTPADFTITRAGNTSGPSTVKYKTSTGTATAGSDYDALPLTTLAFGPGETEKTVSVDVVGDGVDEPNENFSLVLSAPTGASLSDTTGVGYITDDDGTLNPTVSTFHAVGDLTLLEGGPGTSLATFSVTRTGDTSAASTVQYRTSGGTASAGSDYDAVPLSTLGFAAGETVHTVAVTVNGDTLPEGNETVNLVLSAPTGGVLADPTGIATLVNDDGAAYLAARNTSVVEGHAGTTTALFMVTRTGNTDGASSVEYRTTNGTATAGTDYTAIPVTPLSFAPGETFKIVAVDVAGDTAIEKNETFNLILSGPEGADMSDNTGSATIINDD